MSTPQPPADARKKKRREAEAPEPAASPMTLRCREIVASVPAPVLMLPALQTVQQVLGYVPDDAVPVIARAANASVAEVFGVLTFYSDLRRTPPSLVEVHVCLGEACQAVGARELLADAESLIAPGVDAHRVFCMGNCALGPTAVVNGTLVGRASVESVRAHVADALAATGETR